MFLCAFVITMTVSLRPIEPATETPRKPFSSFYIPWQVYGIPFKYSTIIGKIPFSNMRKKIA
jgi:hypothetical protein